MSGGEGLRDSAAVWGSGGREIEGNRKAPAISSSSVDWFCTWTACIFCWNLPPCDGVDAKCRSRQICTRPRVAIGPARGGGNRTRGAEVLIRKYRPCLLVWKNTLPGSLPPKIRLCSAADHRAQTLIATAFHHPPTSLYYRTRWWEQS